ncbi:hypothetical protein BDR26DRAFT_859248 [Obelidium mucronatum]|nr:hypothetical protein BDR26DRAFT_859248 [Obelidium mucronatum]
MRTPRGSFFKTLVASISPVRLFQKRIEVAAQEDLDAHDDEFAADADDEDDEEVIETVQFEYEDDEIAADVVSDSAFESPAKISHSASTVLTAIVYSFISDYLLTPLSALLQSFIAFYNALTATSKIGLLVIGISTTSILIINQRSDLFPPSTASYNLVAYLPPALPKWGDIVIWPTFLDRNAPLVVDWYNTVIATNLERISNAHIYIPQMFATGDGEVRTSKHWNPFFPFRATEPTNIVQSTTSSFWQSSATEFASNIWNRTSSSVTSGLKAVRSFISFTQSPTGTTRTNKFTEESSKIDFKKPLPIDSALLERVTHLEKVIAQIQTGFTNPGESFDGISKEIQENEAQVKSLRELIQTMAGRIEQRLNELDSKDNKSREYLTAVKDSLHDVKNRVDSFIESSEKSQGGTMTQLKAVEGKIAGLVDNVKAFESRLASSEKSFKERVASVVHESVPSLMVVRKDSKTGEIVLDPGFLKLLKEKLVTVLQTPQQRQQQGQVSESRIHELISEKLVAATEGLVTSAQVSTLVSDLVKGLETTANVERRLAEYAPKNSLTKLSHSLQSEIQAAVESLPTAKDLETALKVKSDEYLQKAKELVNEALSGGPDQEESQMILTREQILSLLGKELQTKHDSLRKEMQEKLEEANPANRARLDAEAMKSVMDSLIQSALQKFAADGIGKEDYALSIHGAYVIQALTSEPYTVPSETVFGKALGHRQRIGYGPFIAITEGNGAGKCWAMNGTFGSLGIHLAAGIVPSSFTIDHVAKEVLLPPGNQGLKSAPKDVELWAVLGTDYSAFSRMNLSDPRVRTTPVGVSQEEFPAGILLQTATFDPVVANVQTFQVMKQAKKAIEESGIVPRAVVLRILSNWGNDEFTCLYRVRVHGR